MQKREHFTLHEKYSYGNTGLYKLCHPAILDGRTWSKLGEHGEHGEHGKHGKMENINQITYHSIYSSKYFFVTQNAEDGRESSKM